MDPIADALAAADAGAFTRDPPKTLQGQIRFLARQEKGSTKQVAEKLGITQRSVQRYLKGERKNPPKQVKTHIDQQVRQQWQPRIRQKTRQQAAQRGLLVELRARFGYRAAAGSSDDARVRRLTQVLPPEYARQLLEARTEDERRQALGEGLGFAYFRDGGRRADQLGVEVTDIDYVDIDYLYGQE
jgi:transcriptional regulator with XRE-family HTH domain